MNKSVLLLLCSSFFFTVTHAQNKYFVRFKDKKGTPYSIAQPQMFLAQKSIDRRARYGLSVNESDLPVNPSYISQVNAVPNIVVRHAVKWLNGVVVSFVSPSDEAAGLAAIEQLSFVETSARIRRVRHVPDPADSAGSSNRMVSRFADSSYGGSFTQVQQLKLECLHEKGYTGQGMMISVMDAGFASVPVTDVFDSLRNAGRLLGSKDFVSGASSAYVGGDHGTMVLSCMAAMKPGTAIGTAPGASYWLMRTEEGGSETISEEYNWIRAAEFADSVGTDIITTSLGYTTFDDTSTSHTYATLNGRTAPMSIAATMAARKGIFVLNAAGNDGNNSWKYIGVAADADSICAVGSVKGDGAKSNFSSYGPTADGRIKPDLVAMGEGSWVCSGSICFPANGTSFATPVLAGAVACFWQAHPGLNNIEVLNLLRRSASQAKNPDNNIGWGIPVLCQELARQVPVLLGAEVISTLPETGEVAVRVSPPLKGPGKLDTLLHPGPYRFDLLHRSSLQGIHERVASVTGAHLYLLDTVLTHKGINTLDKKGFYSVEFISAADTLGRTGEAETILLRAETKNNAVHLSWSAFAPWYNYSYTHYRKTPGSSGWDMAGKSSDTSFVDQGPFIVSGTYCYKTIANGQYSDLSIVSPLVNSSQEKCVELKIPDPVTEPFGFNAYIDPESSELALYLSAGPHQQITVEMIDLLGRPVLKVSPVAYEKKMTFRLNDVADYLYYIRVSSNLGTEGRLIAK